MKASLQAHRIETTLTQNGTLTLDHLPFQAGEAVEVIVLPHMPSTTPTDRLNVVEAADTACYAAVARYSIELVRDQTLALHERL